MYHTKNALRLAREHLSGTAELRLQQNPMHSDTPSGLVDSLQLLNEKQGLSKHDQKKDEFMYLVISLPDTF